MKFSKIFLLGVAVFGMASCQQDTGDLGIEQKNPQEEMIDPAQLQLSLSSELSGSTIDLDNYFAQNGSSLPDHLSIPAIKVDSMGNLPAGSELSFNMQFASKADYSDALTYALDEKEIDVATLEEVYNSLFSNVCFETKDVYVRVSVSALVGNTNVTIGGQTYYYLSGSKISIKPVQTKARVLSAEGVNTVDMGNQVLGRIDNGKHQFAGFLYITAPFVLKDVVEGGINLGMGSDGKLVVDGTAQIAVPAEGAGVYFLLATEESATEYTYSLTKVTSAGAIGGFNEWGGDASLTSSEDGLVWSGEVDFGNGGEWKIRFNGGWDIALGENPKNLNPFGGAPNIPLAEGGTYQVTLDLKHLPYTVTLVRK